MRNALLLDTRRGPRRSGDQKKPPQPEAGAAASGASGSVRERDIPGFRDRQCTKRAAAYRLEPRQRQSARQIRKTAAGEARQQA